MRLGEDDAWAKRQKYSNSNIMKNENSADGLEVKRDTFPPPRESPRPWRSHYLSFGLASAG